MNPAMMNPEMMKAAQEMMGKMSPEDMEKMMKMQQQMMSNPAMMQQAQTMMSNPAMQQQAMSQMKNMSNDDLKKNLDQASKQLPAAAAAAAPAAPVSATAKLKASAIAVADDLIEAVEEAENAKTLGNKKFKEGSWEAAASKYTAGAQAVDRVLAKGTLSGGDKKVVYELKEACHLNLANCRLKLGEWQAVVSECDTVLDRPGGASAAGAARKARFRRGDALVQLGELTRARDDLKAAAQMDPSDTVVAGKLRDVQKQLGAGTEDGAPIVEEVEEVDTASSAKRAAPPSAPAGPSASGPMGMAGMGMPPGGMPDPSQMEAMLDNISVR
jgi:tetratricopeptide (TPR) repeat protein